MKSGKKESDTNVNNGGANDGDVADGISKIISEKPEPVMKKRT